VLLKKTTDSVGQGEETYFANSACILTGARGGTVG
jgi:hypothetical protein